MFIQTETTGDPARLRFLPGREVLPEDQPTRHYVAGDAATDSPLARLLLGVEGVAAVTLEADALEIAKIEEFAWQHLKPPVLGAIMEHFMSGRPSVTDAYEAPIESGWEAGDEDAVNRIEKILDDRIRPAIEGYGASIELIGFRDHLALFDLTGPGNAAGRKQAIANIVKHYVPEVEAVAYESDTAPPQSVSMLPPGEPQLDSPEAEAIQKLLDERINPGVASHGGYIELLDVRQDTAYIRMGGGCQGCGAADVTLRQGVEIEIKNAVPVIERIVDVSDHDSGENPYYA
ncbi:MAG: NifU family protein [Alphaproteobacteria bacterium]